jgi:hypothetical protein
LEHGWYENRGQNPGSSFICFAMTNRLGPLSSGSDMAGGLSTPNQNQKGRPFRHFCPNDRPLVNLV